MSMQYPEADINLFDHTQFDIIATDSLHYIIKPIDWNDEVEYYPDFDPNKD